jgi:hypothetical protein
MLKSIITPKNVREQLNKLPPLKTQVLDDIYQSSVRDVHYSNTIDIEEVSAIAKAVPVVARGASSYALRGDSGSQSQIEPLPIVVNRAVLATELNNLKSLTSQGQQIWLRNKLSYMRNVIRKTTEALAIQSLSGKISFAMKTESGLDTYVVEYGDVLSVDSNFNWKNATIGSIFIDLSTMAESIEENQGGTEVVFRAGAKVFAKLLNIVSDAKNNSIEAKVKGNTIFIGGYEIVRYSNRYFDPKDKEYKPAIEDTKIKAIAKDGGFALRYLAIDDVEAGLQPLPIWLKTIPLQDPSGYKVIGHSKPLPIPNIKAICDANVTL